MSAVLEDPSARALAIVATPPAAGFLKAGNPRPVLLAARACEHRQDAVLMVVLDTQGSTSVTSGSMALFAGEIRVGWPSGGCLESRLAEAATRAAHDQRLGFLEIDTRDDAELLPGSAPGCQGRLQLALLPLASMPGIGTIITAWLAGALLQRSIDVDGDLCWRTDLVREEWRLRSEPCPWDVHVRSWLLPLPPLPELLVLGAGPETPTLLALLEGQGWRVTLEERRQRRRAVADLAATQAGGREADADEIARFAAALVMHHGFEEDLDALAWLADTGIPCIALLGPERRRDDLLGLLSPDARERLLPRLRAPVGLEPGGTVPEATALSIVAELQQWRARPSLGE